jgi:hypothetical protein
LDLAADESADPVELVRLTGSSGHLMSGGAAMLTGILVVCTSVGASLGVAVAVAIFLRAGNQRRTINGRAPVEEYNTPALLHENAALEYSADCHQRQSPLRAGSNRPQENATH